MENILNRIISHVSEHRWKYISASLVVLGGYAGKRAYRCGWKDGFNSQAKITKKVLEEKHAEYEAERRRSEAVIRKEWKLIKSYRHRLKDLGVEV